MESKVVDILKIDYKRTVIKDDIIMVYFNDGRFFICDKEYGVKIKDDSYYTVKRVFGAGKGGGDEKD